MLSLREEGLDRALGLEAPLPAEGLGLLLTVSARPLTG